LSISKKYTETIQYESLPDDIQKKILDNNAFDLDLYEYASNEIYPKFKKQYSENIKFDLISFESENKTFSFPKNKDGILKLYQYANQHCIQPFPHLLYFLENNKSDNPKQ